MSERASAKKERSYTRWTRDETWDLISYLGDNFEEYKNCVKSSFYSSFLLQYPHGEIFVNFVMWLIVSISDMALVLCCSANKNEDQVKNKLGALERSYKEVHTLYVKQSGFGCEESDPPTVTGVKKTFCCLSMRLSLLTVTFVYHIWCMYQPQ